MNLGDLSKVRHGGAMQLKKLEAKDGLLDLSASLNPFSPEIDWNPASVSISEYPDDSYMELKESISKNFGCSPEEICIGNGSIEVIRSYFHAILEPGDAVLTEPHTFGEYDLSVRLAGGLCTGDPSSDYRVRVICNPNNPTGSIITREEMTAIADEECPKGRGLFIDEAFMDIADTDETLIDTRREGIFISRSITKSFGVPGIRFGFGIGDPDLVEGLEIARLPWTVNSYAAAYCILAMEHYGELELSRKKLLAEKEWLYGRYEELGVEYCRSSANFILLKCPVPASEFTSLLLKHDIFVRDCTSFGLPRHIRVAVRTREENRKFTEALELCLR